MINGDNSDSDTCYYFIAFQ